MNDGLEESIASIIASLEKACWQLRRPTSQPPPELTTMVGLLAHDESVDEHAAQWDADKWRNRMAETYAGSQWLTSRLTRLVEHFGNERRIRRGQLFTLAHGPPIDFYLGVMAWGFGPTGYGWWRTAEIAMRLGPERLSLAIDRLRERAGNGPGSAWDAWKDHEVSKLPGIGTAFASKLAYFSGFDRATGQGPLISDANTAWGLWALTGIWDSRTARSKYVEYVNLALGWAEAIGCRPDEIERALFSLGPKVRAALKRDPRRLG